MGKPSRSVALNLVATAIWEFGKWFRDWLTHPLTWGWIVSVLTAWWAQASTLDGPTIFVYSLVTAASVVLLIGKVQQWWRQRTGGTDNAPESALATKDKEIAELKEFIKQMTSPVARRKIAVENFVEHFNKMANMTKEERDQSNKEWKRREEEGERERQPLELTTKIVLKSISLLSKNPTKPPIKIVSTPEHMEWATQLAEIFRLSKYELLTSREATNNIFPAKVKHDRLIMRFRAKDEQLLGDKQEFDTEEKFDEEKSQKTFKEIDRYSGCLNTVQAEALMGFEHREFDNSDSRDYFQIEIKGAP